MCSTNGSAANFPGALLGCVADDVTGATDLALNLVQGGMRVVQWLGVPAAADLSSIEADAIVVALKSRSIAVRQAVTMSLDALRRLREAGCQRFYFKYCSTFDSTDDGNIGPVAEALLDTLGCEQTVFCPAFPEAGRTVYAGHLFVHDRLLQESGMQDHPLNPMRDACLVRVLARQARRGVGLLHYRDVTRGPEEIARRLQALHAAGQPLVVVDALNNEHLQTLAEGCYNMALLTGGSGLARKLAETYRVHGLLAGPPSVASMPAVAGRAAIVSGSCSEATRRQVEHFACSGNAWQLDVALLMRDPDRAFSAALEWVGRQPPTAPLLIYSTADPENVATVQDRFGRAELAAQVERFHGRVAKSLVGDYGVRRLVVAGGETAAAVAESIGIRALRIGPAIAPGVPWTETMNAPRIAVAFKSGNFGAADFFQTALEMFA